MWNTSHGLLLCRLVHGEEFLTIFLASPVGNTDDFTGLVSSLGHQGAGMVPSRKL